MAADDTRKQLLTRRRVLGGAVTLLCAPPLLSLASCKPGEPSPGPDAGVPLVDGWEVPPGTTLPAAQYAALAAVFDALIPRAARWPGATDTHAVWYVDQLLGAFDVDPPRIYAGGPYSGRHGGLDGFSQFQRLTRVEELSFRIYLEGTRGLPEREFNGKVTGLQERLAAWLATLDSGFTKLPTEARRRALLSAPDSAFVQELYELCCEGTYGDPVYGGNFERRGWAAVDYEGDRQPVGYTERQMTHPEEG